jgi:hypothetical protein
MNAFVGAIHESPVRTMEVWMAKRLYLLVFKDISCRETRTGSAGDS